jgi:hypothetical protein
MVKIHGGSERDFLDNGLVLPAGYNDRFIKYKYNDIFLIIMILLKPVSLPNSRHSNMKLNQIRLHPELQGYVITEFTDLKWECNGLA